MKRKKDESRFHAMLAPHRVNYNPVSMWKTGRDGLKKVHIYM